MNRELIKKTEEFLKAKFQKCKYFIEHPTAGEYRLQHSYRVANIGKEIAEKEGFDVYRIYETLQHNKFSELSYEEKKEKVAVTLEKLHKNYEMKLGTKTAEGIWKQRIGYYISFYEKLESQLANSTEII